MLKGKAFLCTIKSKPIGGNLMNKRTAMLNLLDNSNRPEYTPAGFFIHFPEEYRHGQAAIDKHLNSSATPVWFVKIQYEAAYPPQPHIQNRPTGRPSSRRTAPTSRTPGTSPADWFRLPARKPRHPDPLFTLHAGKSFRRP